MTALEPGRLSTHHDAIFRSVFHPPPKSHLTKSTLPPGIAISNDTLAAWNLVTNWLRLPQSETEDHITPANPPRGIDAALSTLLSVDDTSKRLIDCLSNEAQLHQHRFLLPTLQSTWSSPLPCSKAEQILSQTLDLLISSHNRVTEPLDQWISSHLDDHLSRAVIVLRSALLERVRASALHSLPSKRLFKTISFVLHASVSAWLLSPGLHNTSREATQSLLIRLRLSGLGGDSGQRAFARAMNSVIDTYVRSPAVKVDWLGRQSVTGRLRTWIRDIFAPAARDCLRYLTDQSDISFFETEVTEWENIALEKLARQRMAYLFEYVRAWSHSTGAILDLKQYIQTAAQGKPLLAKSFGQQMARRILHSGVTTSELLSMYINVICAFKALDQRGVLLDKVASPLRTYLRQRDDTVRIIAASFLADVDADGNVANQSDEVCSDLAREIALSEGEGLKVDERGLDWDDMAWVPDPIDAGPDYRKSKSDDIMTFMLTLFERGDFIQEIQSLLGERLLTVETAQSELDKEIRLVELFKTRFGPDGLQSCEVMLRDIQESRRINNTLRPTDDVNLPTTQEIHAAIPKEGITIQRLSHMFQSRIPRNSAASQQFIKLVKEVAVSDKQSGLLLPKPESHVPTGPSPRFSTLILSSFFWPSLREDEFDLPGPISAMQKAYEQDFERIKNLRKLHWLPALGRVTVELELEDRTVKMEAVQTWQASVIYAFENSDGDDVPVTRTLRELEDSLSMDELLVRNALAFWLGHRVLVEVAPCTYRVLERLPTAEEEAEEAAAAAAAAAAQNAGGSEATQSSAATATAQVDAAATAISAVKTQDAVLHDNKEMYELFMVGMLTNGGAMDPARIAMMMKMVVPGGYAFGDEETRWLCQGLVEQGKLVEQGSNYAIKK